MSAGAAAPPEEPAFREPWEAQAFAMAVALHERGLFTWTEWADRLSRTLAAARDAGRPDDGTAYYLHWLATLEALAAEKGAASPAELSDRRDAWDRAARATPHGEPVVLGAGG